MKNYNQRTWLNPVESDLTDSIVTFDGTITDFKGKSYPSTFLEISNCQNKIRLHIISDDTKQDYIIKLELLRNEIDLFIEHLKNT